jgi:lipopolysaccharide transport system ATP-binding protein
MKPILEVSAISKKYRIQHLSGGYLSLRDRIADVFRGGSTSSEDFWALKDISFQVERGDTVGIIGRNGAGKSTLLKILSRITPPTSGRIINRGRIASLLEVGTGFHPELTGRENISFNGSLLGMKRKEILAKFDEIVDFSGTERFLDTPLKHYSSGMQLRLAFSVAAFLEPEIMVIDEVLAVGDAEFQKKCMGKMEEVSSQQGRTILFVSHHMAAVKKLCRRAILLDNGQVEASGDSVSITDRYLQEGLKSRTERIWSAGGKGTSAIEPLRAAVYALGQTPDAPIKTSDPVVIEMDFINHLHNRSIDLTFDIFDSSGVHLTHFGMVCRADGGLPGGKYRTRGMIPGNLLNTKQYIVSVQFGLDQAEVLRADKDILCFDVVDDIKSRGRNYSKLPGIIHPICDWTTSELT